MLLTKDQIQAAAKAGTVETFPVPEYGGDVSLRTPSEREFDDFQDSLYKRVGKRKDPEFQMKVVRVRLVALCLVDGDGEPMFTEAELFEHPPAAISRLVERCKHICGMGDDDVEDLAKNSGTAPGGGSSSN